jgi:MoaA/NifB/PqqE/SkfB family radical SAM enzyme
MKRPNARPAPLVERQAVGAKVRPPRSVGRTRIVAEGAPTATIGGFALGPDAGNALSVHVLERMQVVLTTRCNLRCTYCNVSQPTYVGADMDAAVFDAVVRDLEKRVPPPVVQVNGHGETTMLPHWVTWVGRLLDRGVRLSIVSNFAAPLRDDEVRLLARFNSITVSLDTIDAEQLAQVRRKVRFATLAENVERVQGAAAEAGSGGPAFALSVGLYDRNFAGLPALARYAVAARVREVWFWRLKKYPDVAGMANVQPIETTCADEQRAALAAYREAEGVLRANGIVVTRPEDLIRALEAHES